jgi:Zn-dependent protease
VNLDSHQLATGLILYLILCASIALHEFGHAKAADLLGDPLPRLQGRVTLNPLAHLDPIGTGLIPLVMIFSGLPFALIGWGKPVQISLPNPRTRIRDDILITAAGPSVNLLIALVVTLAAGLMARFSPMDPNQWMLVPLLAIRLNVSLFVFNLIPIPPLDGSHFFRHLIGMTDENFYRFSRMGGIILLVLINIPSVQSALGAAIAKALMPFLTLMNNVAGYRLF